MAEQKLVAFFRRAITLTLALPACGGATAPIAGSADAGTPGDSGNSGDGGLPHTSCDWQQGSRSTCSWVLTFTGDPVACAGFSGNGSAAECAAVCGVNSEGIAATTCTAGPGGQDMGELGCRVTTGPTCGNMPCCNGGRRTAYFASLGFGPARAGRELGAHFARASCMEASSVEAFRVLRDELLAHGAPKRLVKAASRAMKDERRHVRQTAALARRFGEEPIAPIRHQRQGVRPLAAMALDNAVEGTIRETYSALECAWQAEVAADPVVRATMRRIARDELHHLALSWAVHAWAMGRLNAETRARVATARREEIEELRRELACDPAEPLVRLGGLPKAFQSGELLGAIERMAA
jgi:hypothetical protein